MSSIAVMKACMSYRAGNVPEGRQCRSCALQRQTLPAGLWCTRGGFYVRQEAGCAEFQAVPAAPKTGSPNQACGPSAA